MITTGTGTSTLNVDVVREVRCQGRGADQYRYQVVALTIPQVRQVKSSSLRKYSCQMRRCQLEMMLGIERRSARLGTDQAHVHSGEGQMSARCQVVRVGCRLWQISRGFGGIARKCRGQYILQ